MYCTESAEWSSKIPTACADTMEEVNPPMFARPVPVATMAGGTCSRTLSKPKLDAGTTVPITITTARIAP